MRSRVHPQDVIPPRSWDPCQGPQPARCAARTPTRSRCHRLSPLSSLSQGATSSVTFHSQLSSGSSSWIHFLRRHRGPGPLEKLWFCLHSRCGQGRRCTRNFAKSSCVSPGEGELVVHRAMSSWLLGPAQSLAQCPTRDKVTTVFLTWAGGAQCLALEPISWGLHPALPL